MGWRTFPSSPSSQWRWNGGERRFVVGENELARLAGHQPEWDLHRRASGEAQMEASRHFKVIKMVEMR